MIRRALLLAASLPALAVPMAAIVASAQDAPPPRLVLDFGLDLRQGSNPDLAADGRARSSGALNLGLTLAHVTRDQQFRLTFSGALQAQGDTEPAVQPGIDLSYALQGQNSKLDLALSSQRSRVSLSEPATLSDGGLSYGDLVATDGQLRSSSGRVSFQAGLDGPLGFNLSAAASAQDYSQTTDPSVRDSQSRSLSAGVDLRNVAGGTLGLSLDASASRTQDDDRTARDSRGATLSWDRALDGATKLSASLGATTSETHRLGVLDSRSSGATGALSLTRDLGRGTVELGFDLGRDSLGARQSLHVTRQVDLKTGKFSAELGYSARDGKDGAAIGQLSWTQTLPADSLSLSLSRQVVLNNDDVDTLQSAASVDWQHKLGATSSLGLSYGFSAIDAAGSESFDAVTRQSLTASWQKDLARDWSLTSGVTFSDLNRDSTGQADDTTLFLTIGHKFVLLP